MRRVASAGGRTAVGLLVALSAGCGPPHSVEPPRAVAMRVLDEHAAGQEVGVAPGESFGVRLEENPTTGFRWELLDGGAPVCVLVDDVYEAPGAGRPGRGGRRTWTFRVKRTGRAVIELALRRPWQPHAAPAKTFRVSVSAAN